MEFKEKMLVKALRTITEGGSEDEADYTIKDFAGNPGYVHGPKGCLGVVEYVNEDGQPTVRFDFRGTATIVGTDEVEWIGQYLDPKIPEGIPEDAKVGDEFVRILPTKIIVWGSWETVVNFGTDDADYLSDGEALCLGAFDTAEEAEKFIMTLGSKEHLVEGCPGV